MITQEFHDLSLAEYSLQPSPAIHCEPYETVFRWVLCSTTVRSLAASVDLQKVHAKVRKTNLWLWNWEIKKIDGMKELKESKKQTRIGSTPPSESSLSGAKNASWRGIAPTEIDSKSLPNLNVTGKETNANHDNLWRVGFIKVWPKRKAAVANEFAIDGLISGSYPLYGPISASYPS